MQQNVTANPMNLKTAERAESQKRMKKTTKM